MKRKNPPQRSYSEVMEDFQKAETPYEYRIIHIEMKQSGYGSVPIWLRYPYLPLTLSLISFLVSFTVLIVLLLRLWLRLWRQQ